MVAFIVIVAALAIFGLRHMAKPVPVKTWSGTVMRLPYKILVQDRDMTATGEDSLRIHLAELLTGMDARFSRQSGMGLVADFNKRIVRTPFYIGSEVWRVIDFEKRLSGVCGAVDISVAPLEDLWAKTAAGGPAPAEDDVKRLLYEIGMDRLNVPAEPYVCKMHPETAISLDTIAHGYIADHIAIFMQENHVSHFQVEIGGVVLSRNMPAQSAAIPACTPGPGEPPAPNVRLMSAAMASAGAGDGFIHIDPRTGHPVSNGTRCVTVVAESGLVAKGLACALYTLGPVEGLPWLETNGVAKGEALFIMDKPGGGFVKYKTKRFPLAEP